MRISVYKTELVCVSIVTIILHQSHAQLNYYLFLNIFIFYILSRSILRIEKYKASLTERRGYALMLGNCKFEWHVI